MRLLLLCLIACLHAACGIATSVVEPGGRGVARVRGPGVYATGPAECFGNVCRQPVAYDPGGKAESQAAVGFVGGAKLGVARGRFDDRETAVGIDGEIHADLMFQLASGRSALALSGNVLSQRLYYDDDDVLARTYGATLAYHFAVRRRFAVFAGAGVGFGHLSVGPDEGPRLEGGMTELRAFGGSAFVLRRTPIVDLTIRAELGAFRTTAADLETMSGGVSGTTATVEMLISGFF